MLPDARVKVIQGLICVVNASDTVIAIFDGKDVPAWWKFQTDVSATFKVNVRDSFMPALLTASAPSIEGPPTPALLPKNSGAKHTNAAALANQ